MDQKRITDYINSLDQGHGVLCDKIAKEGPADHDEVRCQDHQAL